MKRLLLGFAALLTLGLVAAEAAPTQRPTYLGLDKGTKTAAATAGAATLSKTAGKVTSEALTTAAAAAYTLTITNTKVAAADQCFASVAYGTSTTGVPAVTRVTPGASSLVIVVRNIDAAAALNGTIVVSFFCLKN
jgi:hypothetical protein